jgi:hypothetical protein
MSWRATVPISLQGASTAICGYNFFAAIRSASSARPIFGPLDAHQFVEHGKPVEPYPARCEEIRTSEGCVSGFGHSERHTGAARLQHAERRAKGGAAERVEDQPERPVRLGGG